jgi:glycosyltransferase involved in cell wall biosynthesis
MDHLFHDGLVQKMDVRLMKKVLLITNIPTPYRIPLFNELHEQLRAANVELMVVFSNEGYERRQFTVDKNDFKFPYEILDGGTFTPGKDQEFTFFLYKGLWKKLRQLRPDHIIVSGFSPATLLVCLYKFFYRTPYSIWSGSILAAGRKNSFWRTISRKFLVGQANSFVAYGSKAKTYLEHLGAKSDKISIAINTVDTRFFKEKTLEERKKLTGPSPYTFTCLGYLVPRKNMQRVLDAVAMLSQRRRDFRVDIIGDGESRKAMEEYVISQQLYDIVHFHGYRQKAALPNLLAPSRVLLFQTDFDIWGLVLNECMSAGLCCMASPNAGATTDLIVHKQTGLILDFDNPAMVAQAMEEAIEHPNSIEVIGKKAMEFIQENANLHISARGFVDAIKLAGHDI